MVAIGGFRKDGFMRTKRDRTKLFADVRSLVEIAVGVLAFGALMYLITHRFAESTGATEFLFWVHYFAVRATLSGLMVYSGIKSSGKNPQALFGLNWGIGLSCLFMGTMNILECVMAKGDWKDVVTAILFLPAGLAVLYTTSYLRKKKQA